ncbi:transposable element Tcb2 transposase [Trichonephila clavipes]|nr:transposable element Tcb2 transposase [Trichonephila clavipes]
MVCVRLTSRHRRDRRHIFIWRYRGSRNSPAFMQESVRFGGRNRTNGMTSGMTPYMNPIEHIWDALGRVVAGRQPPQQTLQELERALLEEKDRIPQLVINSLIDFMPQS